MQVITITLFYLKWQSKAVIIYLYTKSDNKDKTTSSIKQLNKEERIAEIAKNVTGTQKQH